MKNVENLLQDLLAEHSFLKEMQGKIVENYDIIARNQHQNSDNHAVVVQNQATIIKNQELIVKNQINIIRNQRQIVQNQVTLDVMLKLQAKIINTLKKINEDDETLAETEAMIENLKATSKENLRFDAFNSGDTL
jgi:hypothetical protein